MIDARVSDTPFLALGRSADGPIQTRGVSSCLLGQPLDYGRETPEASSRSGAGTARRSWSGTIELDVTASDRMNRM
jgi:hypothetical protein